MAAMLRAKSGLTGKIPARQDLPCSLLCAGEFLNVSQASIRRPVAPENKEPSSIPVLAATSIAGGYANPALNSDIVKPIPVRKPPATISGQVTVQRLQRESAANSQPAEPEWSAPRRSLDHSESPRV